jgi:hypothetical protein
VLLLLLFLLLMELLFLPTAILERANRLWRRTSVAVSAKLWLLPCVNQAGFECEGAPGAGRHFCGFGNRWPLLVMLNLSHWRDRNKQ